MGQLSEKIKSGCGNHLPQPLIGSGMSYMFSSFHSLMA
jgi:hypothetical protein